MAKDKRYTAVKALIESGNIKSFDDLFSIVPKTVVREDIGLNYYGLDSKLKNGRKFLLQDLLKMAEKIECDPRLVIEMALLDISRQSKSKRK